MFLTSEGLVEHVDRLGADAMTTAREMRDSVNPRVSFEHVHYQFQTMAVLDAATRLKNGLVHFDQRILSDLNERARR